MPAIRTDLARKLISQQSKTALAHAATFGQDKAGDGQAHRRRNGLRPLSDLISGARQVLCLTSP